MSAPAPPGAPALDPLKEPGTIDDVVHTLGQVVDWSIKAESHIGYFAALYKRITMAIHQAVRDGVFDNGRLIEELDVAFGRRYFNALNAYFYPDKYPDLTLPWGVTFVGDQDDQAIILQHMIAGLNSHITFDLGLGLLAVAGNSLDTLTGDYHRVNDVLCAQIPGIVKVADQLSPDLRWARLLIPDEIGVLKAELTKLRTGAWLFAIYMATHRQSAREKALRQAAWTAALSSWYLQPSGRWSPFPRLIRVIAKHESDDVASNIRALEEISNRPDKAFR